MEKGVKIMERVRKISKKCISNFITFLAFGGGCILFGMPLMFIFQNNANLARIIFLLSLVLPTALAWCIPEDKEN